MAKESPVDALRLKASQVARLCDPRSLGFESTAELEPITSLIGQERALRSLDFGLQVKNSGYNVFVVGRPGSGRTTYVLNRLVELAKGEPAPSDWCYVFNFKNPGSPQALELPASMGRVFAKAVDDLIQDLRRLIPRAFEKGEYEEAKAVFIREFQEKVNDMMDELKRWAFERGFAVKRTPQGFVNVPLLEEEMDGRPVKREMRQEEFEALSDEEKRALQRLSEEISNRTMEVLREIRNMEKDLQLKIKELDREICRNVVEQPIAELKSRFSFSDKIGAWLDDLMEDVLDNFGAFIAVSEEKDGDKLEFTRYKVNVFVSREEGEGAPVVRETNPTYYNLMGKVEYESRMGFLYTDFTRIMAGAIHRANGGYLVLEAEDLLRNFFSWEALKRVLKTGEIRIENLGEQLGFIPMSSLRPEAIPVKLKVVVIGQRWLYHLLSVYDQEFQKLFKVKADFDVDMERNEETERGIARFIAGMVRKEGLRHFSAEAVAKVVDYASRLASHQGRMSTQFNRISEVVIEANYWATRDGLDVVMGEHVERAIQERTFRVSLIEDKIKQMFRDGQILVDTEGKRVGQINGLTVINVGDHVFGRPVRITANCFMGDEGVVHIERETKLAGPIHNKGVMILASYISSTYGQDMPISMSARLTFEQTYEEVEGDSASSTELYCLLSALSGLPLDQGIAVTGSVNQKGEIQPIGGVNEKIEGFFDYCFMRGLTGRQGVIIPRQNVCNLMLRSDVRRAIEEGKFHLWAVSTVEEGIEILTGVPAGRRLRGGGWSKGSVHHLVSQRLKEWERIIRSGRSGERARSARRRGGKGRP